MSYEEAGAVLAVAGKQEAFAFIKSALSPRFRRILHAASASEARQCVGRERVMLAFLFTPLGDESGIDAAFELEERKGIASVLVVKPEIYQDVVYKARDHRVFILTYPAQKGILLQTANLLHQTQIQLYKAMMERDELKMRISDLAVISRVKCLLVEKRNMTESDAHHYIEKKAMDRGLTKRKAAEVIQQEEGII